MPSIPSRSLQELIRFDTTNPPGNEEACVAHIESLLREHGIESERYEKTPGTAEPDRAARRARTAARRSCSTATSTSSRPPASSGRSPPFGGRDRRRLRLGPRRARHEGRRRDVRRRVRRGARSRARATPLVLAHPERRGERRRRRREVHRRGASRRASAARGTRSASSAARRSGSPDAASTRSRWRRSRSAGCARTCAAPGGHGALGVKGGAMRKLGDMLRTLDRQAAAGAHHPARPRLVRADGGRAAAPAGAASCAGCSTRRRPTSPSRALGPRGRQLRPRDPQHGQPDDRPRRRQDQRHPERGRARSSTAGSCPGFDAGRPDPRAARARRRRTSSSRSSATIPGPPDPDLSFYEPLAQIIRELDPGGIPVPMLQAGVTDARFLSRAGIQTYGFLPLRLPEDFELFPLIHNADERVPGRRARVRRRRDRAARSSGIRA